MLQPTKGFVQLGHEVEAIIGSAPAILRVKRSVSKDF